MRERGPKPSAVVSGGTEPGFTLHKLRHDDFHEICGLVETFKTIKPDSKNGKLVGKAVLAPEGFYAVVTGYAVDVDTNEVTRFARVKGRLYHEGVLKRA